jgi:hypothetical protein
VFRRLTEAGASKDAVPMMMAQIHIFETRRRGRLFSLYEELARVYGASGDIDHTEQLAGVLDALLAESRSWPSEYDPYRPEFQAQVSRIDAYLRELRDQNAEAEVIYRRARLAQADALDR